MATIKKTAQRKKRLSQQERDDIKNKTSLTRDKKNIKKTLEAAKNLEPSNSITDSVSDAINQKTIEKNQSVDDNTDNIDDATPKVDNIQDNGKGKDINEFDIFDYPADAPPNEFNQQSNNQTGIIQEVLDIPEPQITIPDMSSEPTPDKLTVQDLKKKERDKSASSEDETSSEDELSDSSKKESVDNNDDGNSSQKPSKEKSEYSARNISNSEMDDASPREKKRMAEAMVARFWAMYDDLHRMGRNFVQVKEEKLYEMHMNGEVDLNMEVPITENYSLNLLSYFQTYNKTTNAALVVDQDLKDELTPPMIRECIKRNIGLTDMQQILFGLGQDFVTKVSMVVAFKLQETRIIKNYKKFNDQIKKEREELEKEKNKLQKEKAAFEKERIVSSSIPNSPDAPIKQAFSDIEDITSEIIEPDEKKNEDVQSQTKKKKEK